MKQNYNEISHQKSELFAAVTVVAAVLLLPVGCNNRGKATSNPNDHPDTVAAAAVPQLDRAKFHELYRASKAIQAGTQTGVTVAEYRKLVRDLRTQLLMFNGQTLNPEEQKVVAAYDQASRFQADVARFWEVRSETWRCSQDTFGDPSRTQLNKEGIAILTQWGFSRSIRTKHFIGCLKGCPGLSLDGSCRVDYVNFHEVLNGLLLPTGSHMLLEVDCVVEQGRETATCSLRPDGDVPTL